MNTAEKDVLLQIRRLVSTAWIEGGDGKLERALRLIDGLLGNPAPPADEAGT